MSQQAASRTPISTLDEAERAIANLQTIMDSLSATVAEETERLRVGRISDAMALNPVKTDLAGRYALEAERMKAARAVVAKALPAKLDALRQRHEAFQLLLRKNLTVLATAHAVSEGIVRGVSGEMTRKAAPSTYGATGRANAPGPRAAQPIAVSKAI